MTTVALVSSVGMVTSHVVRHRGGRAPPPACSVIVMLRARPGEHLPKPVSVEDLAGGHVDGGDSGGRGGRQGGVDRLREGGADAGHRLELLHARRPQPLERAELPQQRLLAGLAEPGDVVLLAPACASFDQYKNFEARGEHFKSIVHRLQEERS